MCDDAQMKSFTWLCPEGHAIRSTFALRALQSALIVHDVHAYCVQCDHTYKFTSRIEENLRAWLFDPQRIKPGALMPGYPGLSEEDLRALVDYLGGLK